MKAWIADENRYDGRMKYRRLGRTGLHMPLISLGLWHNFGGVDAESTAREILCAAFDAGITHFDLANNYGPPPGSAEALFGRVLRSDLGAYRDEMLITTKAGWRMWPGPYGEWGSRKYLVASCDQSLRRMGVDYVDIFYSHRPDPETPLEETMAALDYLVRSGRALYVGISSYPPEMTRRAAEILHALGTPCVVHQPRYNMFQRDIEGDLLPLLAELGMGCVAFSPLAQGILAGRYTQGIPEDSRAGRPSGYLKPELISESQRRSVQALQSIAEGRGQSLAQMALSWALRDERVTSVIAGASRVQQLRDNLGALEGLDWSSEELERVDLALRA